MTRVSDHVAAALDALADTNALHWVGGEKLKRRVFSPSGCAMQEISACHHKQQPTSLANAGFFYGQLTMARPSDYTDELAIHICTELAKGLSLVSICNQDNMPDISTVYRWRLANPEFRDMYARAREDQADTLADQIVEIADESVNDTYLDADGNERTNHEVVARSKLRVDARKWVAAKLKPRSYGDKLDLTHSGELNVKSLSDDDLDKRIAEVAGKAGIAIAADGEGEA